MHIPVLVQSVLAALESAGYEAYVVGGSVRDALRGVEPHDWDVATNATPEQIQTVFKHTLYENRFGTVVVRLGELDIEVTTYRVDGEYSDHRRPSTVSYTSSLIEDLARRDFTINAMAYRDKLIDPFDGAYDIQRRLIRTVGHPNDRFNEDALRMLRAVRFASTFGYHIADRTRDGIRAKANLAGNLSGERVQQELVKMLAVSKPSIAFRMLSEVGLLIWLCPEIEVAKDTPQDKEVVKNVFDHLMMAVDASPNGDPLLRLACLLHDIGKPDTDDGEGHFYGHEYLGEVMAKRIMRRWKFDNDSITRVTRLIRHHMFWFQEDWTPSAIRRFIRNVGMENMPDLFAVRRADNYASGGRRGQGTERVLASLEQRMTAEMTAANAFSIKDLKVNGTDIMTEFQMKPGPEVGRVLRELFEMVTDDPALNEREKLLELAKSIRE